jgi:hypothetical protein
VYGLIQALQVGVVAWPDRVTEIAIDGLLASDKEKAC